MPELTGGVAAPGIQLAVARQRQHVTPAERHHAGRRKRWHRSRHCVELRRGSSQRAFAIESPGMDRSNCVDSAEQVLARCNRVRALDICQQLRYGRRYVLATPTNASGVRTPYRNAVLRCDAETDPVPARKGYQLMLRVELHRRGVRFQRAAIFRCAGRDFAAAIATPAKHSAIVEQGKRMVSTATDRSDHMAMFGVARFHDVTPCTRAARVLGGPARCCRWRPRCYRR